MNAVIVWASPEVSDRLHPDGKKVYAARIRKLGLTAYGDSEEHALERVTEVFHFAMKAYREHDIVEERLNKSLIDWEWQSDSSIADDELILEVPTYVDAPHSSHVIEE